MFHTNDTGLVQQRVHHRQPHDLRLSVENDSNKNLKYPRLDDKIRNSCAAQSTGVLKNSLYDSYIRAIRWASDRIKDRGVVCYVTNGSFIDGNSMDGLRACLFEEFTSIYCFNIRGNARTSGELRQQEGGNVFGGGSKAPIAITLLIKNPDRASDGTIYYSDIGDYLTREQKLAAIADIDSPQALSWEAIEPNKNHDWINQRDPAFMTFVPLGEKQGEGQKTLFEDYSGGVKTNRDGWCYNFSRDALAKNMRRMINFYNTQVDAFGKYSAGKPKAEIPGLVEGFIDTDPTKISWTREVKQDLGRLKRGTFRKEALRASAYRPFTKHEMYFDRQFNNCVYQLPRIFPKPSAVNQVICVTGMGTPKQFDAYISDATPDVQLQANGQCFPLYLFEGEEPQEGQLIAKQPAGQLLDGLWRKDAITDWALVTFRRAYDAKLTKLDIFYYVYGILHSPEYKRRFASDLKKMLPRIPMAGDFWAFSTAGRKLAELHLNYEKAPPYKVKQYCDELALDPKSLYRVEKMRFGKPPKGSAKKEDKTTIIYNSHITITGIPLEAYDYVVNGKPAIEWITERYQKSRDKDSGIENDPNDWALEHDDPEYVLRLLKSIITVSLETMKIVNALPALNERTDP